MDFLLSEQQSVMNHCNNYAQNCIRRPVGSDGTVIARQFKALDCRVTEGSEEKSKNR